MIMPDGAGKPSKTHAAEVGGGVFFFSVVVCRMEATL